MSRLQSLSLASIALLLVSACRHDEERQPERVPVTVSRAPNAAQRALGTGDVRITDENDAIELALIGDSISAGLSETALAKARRETDTSTVHGTGFGASIERMVKSKVQVALTTRGTVPLSSVKDVRYENGEIKFDWNGKPPQLGSVKSNDKPLMKSFRPADAQRFVEAVHARLKQPGAY